MQRRYLAALAQLEEVEWFRNVGVHDSDKAVIVPSWMEAIASCAAYAWESLTLEAANQLSEAVFRQDRARFQEWNHIAEEVKAVTLPLIDRKTEKVTREHGLPKVFRDCVEWDIVHLAMTCEYDDLHPPRFYLGQAYWYLAGHFPCGWDGPFPTGRIIVY